ncbi:MAG: tyrosine-type recombinase/integrase, partial [Chthonomonadales bacterium]
FQYLTHGHEQVGGRWGNARLTERMRPQSVQTYYNTLKTFFRWMIEEGAASSNPMERIPTPIARVDQVNPFSAEEIRRIQEACKTTRYAARDRAIIDMFLDTGARESELLFIEIGDVDMTECKVMVTGKGNKRRQLYFGRHTKASLWRYLRGEIRQGNDDRLFRGEKGDLTRSGLYRIIKRLEDVAHVSPMHPHRFRHTFAVTFLRSGGNVYALKDLLGHTDFKMTQRYVALAQSDMAAQHRKHSPVEFMRKSK